MPSKDESIFVVKSRKGFVKRRALIQAAHSYLSEYDLRSLTIAHLCDEVGLKRNSFYTHFSDLDELLDALSAKIISGYLSHINENHPVDPNLFSVTRERIGLLIELAKSQSGTAKVLHQLYIHHRPSFEAIQNTITDDVLFWIERGYVHIESSAAPTFAQMLVSIFMDILRQIGDGHGDQIDIVVVFDLLSRLVDPQKLNQER